MSIQPLNFKPHKGSLYSIWGQRAGITRFLSVFFAALALWGCTTTPSPRPGSEASFGGCQFYQSGLASWYGNELLGNRTANGEMFVPDGITAAHKTLPFGTMVKVTLDGGKGNPEGVMVRINDRGPFVRGRIIDLSAGAARMLGVKNTMPVKIYRCH